MVLDSSRFETNENISALPAEGSIVPKIKIDCLSCFVLESDLKESHFPHTPRRNQSKVSCLLGPLFDSLQSKIKLLPFRCSVPPSAQSLPQG